MRELVLRTLEDTDRLAVELALACQPGDAVLLSGDLGAGKSELARRFLRNWTGDPELEVPSPTFTLIQTYDAVKGSVWHCDLYRLSDEEELYELGIEQAFGECVTLIEWPDRLGALVPRDRLEVTMEICEGDERKLTLNGFGRLEALSILT